MGHRYPKTIYLAPWIQFCSQNNIDPVKATLNMGTQFLLHLHKKGLGYSAINTARCAMSALMEPIEGMDFGKHPIVSKLLKGFFKKRPALPRYIVIYDADIVLRFLQYLPSWENISLKWLTFKTSTLLAIITGHRCQSLHMLNLDFMHIDPNRIIFYFPHLLKNTTPTFHAQPIKLIPYHDEQICPIRTIVEYIKATATTRKSRKLLLSYRNHQEVTTQTIGRYVKTTLTAAGINTTTFSVHSTRHAISSKNAMTGVPLKDILKRGGWKSSSTFAKHYIYQSVGTSNSAALRSQTKQITNVILIFI